MLRARQRELLGEAIQNNASFLTLRKIEAAREIAGTVASSNNRVLLSADRDRDDDRWYVAEV